MAARFLWIYQVVSYCYFWLDAFLQSCTQSTIVHLAPRVPGPLRNGFGFSKCGNHAGFFTGSGSNSRNDSSLGIHSVNYPVVKGGIRHFASWIFGPFNHKLSFSESVDKLIAPAISALFLRCNPSAVFWSVISVIVYPVYLFVVGVPALKAPLSEVFKLEPFRTDGYSTTSISRIVQQVWISAAIKYSAPYPRDPTVGLRSHSPSYQSTLNFGAVLPFQYVATVN